VATKGPSKKSGSLSKRDGSADQKPGVRGGGTLSKKESTSALPALGGGRQSSNENSIQNPQMETDRTKGPVAAMMNVT